MYVMLAFAALADPTRRRIVEMIASRDRTAGEIVEKFDMTAPAISQHLKVLREAKLITVRVDAQRRIHSINPAGFDDVGAWMTRTRHQWERRLDALEQVLRDEDKRRRAKK